MSIIFGPRINLSAYHMTFWTNRVPTIKCGLSLNCESLVLEANVIKSRWLKADTTLSQQWFLKNIEVKDGKDNGSRELDIFKSLQKIETIIQKMNLHDRERVKLFFKCLLSV